MASNFTSLRNARKENINRLIEQTKNESKKQGQQDERFWKLTFDPKTKIGSAVIRFLPEPQNEKLPWVRIFQHAFQGPSGMWYIENCPTTLDGRSCPVCKDNKALWKGTEAEKALAGTRKRKLGFISNIQVIDDSSHPEFNGKVKLYKYGAKIHDMIKSQYEPEFAEDTPRDPFCLWQGCNFKIRSRDDKGYLTYDKSSFADPTPLCGGDEAEMEKVWLQAHSLQAFLAESQFKSYEDLDKRFQEVLSGDRPKSAADKVKDEQDEDVDDLAQKIDKNEKKAEAKKSVQDRFRAKKETKEEPKAPVEAAGDDDEIKDFFRQLGDE